MSKDFVPITRALFSVTNKSGLVDLAKSLREINPSLEIIASGGTAKTLEKENILFTLLSDYTGFPECLDGRVKTLHPLIAGGILMRKNKDEQEASQLGIKPIDLIVCNLYDFANASSNHNLEVSQLMESMDIGGSTLIRSACKNYQDVTVIVNPADYPLFLEEVRQNRGAISLASREEFAVKGLNTSANYESLLARVLSKKLGNEDTRRPYLRQGKQLRYGENPDQKAWVYSFPEQEGVAKSHQLSGAELSYNNYEDSTVAYNAAQELLELNAKHGVAIIKHGSLCAYATGNSLKQAFHLAWEGDSKSAYGSVIAFTSSVTEELIDPLKNKFIEVLIAPNFSESFLNWIKEHKPRVRILQIPNNCRAPYQYKNISGGMLIQTPKQKLISESFEELFAAKSDESQKRVGVVTSQKPQSHLKGLFAFGIAAVNYAKSNAVAVVREPEPGTYQLIGMGAGQPNRIDSLERLAIPKAIENLQHENNFNPSYDPKQDLEKCVIASDGFFPFDDSIKYAARVGIKNCIQPGGGKRDQEVINAANEHGICMVFTGSRYFYH